MNTVSKGDEALQGLRAELVIARNSPPAVIQKALMHDYMTTEVCTVNAYLDLSILF